jgi:hypothetical protein
LIYPVRLKNRSKIRQPLLIVDKSPSPPTTFDICNALQSKGLYGDSAAFIPSAASVSEPASFTTFPNPSSTRMVIMVPLPQAGHWQVWWSMGDSVSALCSTRSFKAWRMDEICSPALPFARNP